MDTTQVGLGTGLLAVSSVTFVGSSTLESNTVYALIAVAFVAGAGSLLVNVAREAQASRFR